MWVWMGGYVWVWVGICGCVGVGGCKLHFIKARRTLAGADTVRISAWASASASTASAIRPLARPACAVSSCSRIESSRVEARSGASSAESAYKREDGRMGIYIYSSLSICVYIPPALLVAVPG